VTYEAEFETVDLIVRSNAETRGVDAFALALIKAERQMRRLVTHLVYQFPAFGVKEIPQLRDTLWDNRRVYFEGFERGFDALYPRSIKELVGVEYDRLRPRLNEAIDHRNKLFHGQLTSKWLTRDDLLEFVADIRSWCGALGDGAKAEIGYDGFARDSFQKSSVANLATRPTVLLAAKTYGKDVLNPPFSSVFARVRAERPIFSKTCRRCMA